MFADTAKIFIRSGKGGNGHVSFRRELYVPDGGPDGGDGGKGGDIVFQVEDGLNTLADFRHKTKYAAQPGQEGGKRRCHGANGEDLVIKVPEGTVIRDFETGKVIADMSGENRREVILKGGRGGLGNMHFATASMQAPKYAQPGQDAQELWVRLELRVIADVGLVGYPNVGKSTILSMCSNARPQIANYHFTTINPHLGVVELSGHRSFVMADIPGLIEGASEGVGLGHQFLRHIERCKVLIHVVDIAGTEGRDPLADVEAINRELSQYDPAIMEKPMIIAANKVDCLVDAESPDSPLAALQKLCAPRGVQVFPISAASNQGLKELLEAAWSYVEKTERKPLTYAKEFDPSSLRTEDLPYTVVRESEHAFRVEGPKIEKMLGYTNLESERGFEFFQKFMEEQGILEQLRKEGVQEGDTIKIYGFEFDYL